MALSERVPYYNVKLLLAGRLAYRHTDTLRSRICTDRPRNRDPDRWIAETKVNNVTMTSVRMKKERKSNKSTQQGSTLPPSSTGHNRRSHRNIPRDAFVAAEDINVERQAKLKIDSPRLGRANVRPLFAWDPARSDDDNSSATQ